MLTLRCRVFIVHGDYPTTLLAEWDRFKISHTADSDEQIRPGQSRIHSVKNRLADEDF